MVLKGERLGNERSSSRFGFDPGLRFSFSAGQKFSEAKKWQRPFTKGTTASPYSQNINSAGSFILLIFTRKVSTVTFSEGGIHPLPIEK